MVGFPKSGHNLFWMINQSVYRINALAAGNLPGHNISGRDLSVYAPMNLTEYICLFVEDAYEEKSNPAIIIIIAGECTCRHPCKCVSSSH